MVKSITHFDNFTKWTFFVVNTFHKNMKRRILMWMLITNACPNLWDMIHASSVIGKNMSLYVSFVNVLNLFKIFQKVIYFGMEKVMMYASHLRSSKNLITIWR
jgi:hypothetical protein